MLGTLILVIGLPPALLWTRGNQEGELASEAAEHSGKSLRQGLLSYSFWIIVAVLFLDSISIKLAMTHQVPLLTDRGIAAGSAASTVSVLGGASLLGRLSTGWLLDRFPGPWVAFVLLMSASAGIFLLARAPSSPQASVAAVLLGLGAGGTSSITPYLLTRYFGLRSFSTLYGLTWTFYAIAGAAGPVLLGHAFDQTGSYTSMLTMLAFACALAAVLMLLLPRHHIPKYGETTHAAHCSS